MAVSDILIQNYNQILSLSLTFLGIILAIFFTLIALPLQNILGKYSQDLVNRVNRDQWLIFCYSFFIIAFAYDFTLLILPKSIDLIIISFLLGLLSLAVFSLLVIRVYYLLDVRNQIKDISNKIIKEIHGKKTRIKIFKADIKLTDRLIDETEIIFDIVQKAVHEDRFEIVAFGLNEAVIIANSYIAVKGINLGKEYNDPFLDHIYDRLIDTKSFVSRTNHPQIMNSIVNSIGSVTKEILSTESIDPITTNQWGPLSSLTFAFIESLKNICIGPEIEKRTSYASGNAGNQIIEIGLVSIDNKYPYRAVDVAHELGDISRKTTEMNFYRGNRLAQSTNQGIIYLLEHSLNYLENIEIDKEYILTSYIDEIADIIREYFKNKAIHEGSRSENIKPIINPQANHSISVIYLKSLKKIEEDVKDTGIILKFMDNFLNLLDNDIKLGMKEGRYFDIKDITDSLYTTGFNLISVSNIDHLSKIDNNSLNEDSKSEDDFNIKLLGEMLLVLYNPILLSLKLKKRIIPLSDYLNNYVSLLGLLFFKNIENNKLLNIISSGINIIELNKDIIQDNPELLPYIRLIGLWLFKWMPDSKLLGNIKDLLENENKTIISKNLTKETDLNKRGNYQELYPQLSNNFWNLKIPFKNDNALIKPFDEIKEEFNEINEIMFNIDDLESYERFLNDLK